MLSVGEKEVKRKHTEESLEDGPSFREPNIHIEVPTLTPFQKEKMKTDETHPLSLRSLAEFPLKMEI